MRDPSWRPLSDTARRAGDVLRVADMTPDHRYRPGDRYRATGTRLTIACRRRSGERYAGCLLGCRCQPVVQAVWSRRSRRINPRHTVRRRPWWLAFPDTSSLTPLRQTTGSAALQEQADRSFLRSEAQPGSCWLSRPAWRHEYDLWSSSLQPFGEHGPFRLRHSAGRSSHTMSTSRSTP
jgi:hypothetical protein